MRRETARSLLQFDYFRLRTISSISAASGSSFSNISQSPAALPLIDWSSSLRDQDCIGDFVCVFGKAQELWAARLAFDKVVAISVRGCEYDFGDCRRDDISEA